jgi:RHS repeat-associated protein
MGSTMVRSYAFSYVTRPASGRSLLASITESTPEGELPPTTFAYTNPPDSWVQDDRWAPPGKIDYFGNTVFADINGDGRPDCIQLVSDGDQYKMKFYFNTPTGWQEAPSWDRILPGCNEFDKLGEVRFADLNGDGLMDFMRRSDGYAYINTGSGFEYSSYWSLGGALNGAQAVSTLASGLDPKSISFIDLNGDGRPECVIYGTGMGPDGSSVTNCAVYVNRSSEGASGYWGANGWVAGQEPPATANAWEGMGNLANFGANGRRLCDFNGDGIPDFFESTLEYYNPNNPGLYTTRRQVYLGSSNDPRQANPLYDTEVNALYKPPVPTLIRDLETGASQAPSELVDINGDGLMDLVRNNSSFLDKGEEATGHEIWFNTGDGWEEAGYQYHLPEAIARTQQSAGWYYYDPTGAAFVDINNDGVVDVISSTGSDSDYVALGRIYGGWSTSSNYQLPWPLFKYTRLYSADTYYPDNESGSELLDLNGDGALDMVWHDGTNSGAALNRRANPDRLEKVTDGFGVSHTITYAPLTDATVYTRGETHPDSTQAEPLTNITPAMHVVKTITRDSDAPSAEPGTGAYDINYRYGGMRRHRLHGSLGFEWMGITDTRAGIENTTVYSQLFPTIGMGIASWSRIHGQGYGTNGALISESNTAYTTLLLNDDKTRFTYPSTVETASYNPDDGVLLTCATVTTENYDSYGNPGVVTTITGTGAGAVTLIVTNTYNNTVDSLTAATPRWHLGQLIASVSTASSASAPSNVLSNKTTRAYDETTGYLLSETLEPDAPASTNLTLTTAYGYDAYGNRSTVTVTGAAPSSARTTTTTYDTRGRFPVSVTNALGHTQTTTYNETLGVPATTTDPNGLTTTWTHDSLGRVTSETRPDGTQTLTALRWAGRSAPPGALTVVETESTGAAPAAAFQDRLGRAIYEVSINPGTFDGNPRITGIRTDYDNRGRVTQTTIPAYLHTPDEAAVQNYYDALDRIVSVERPRDEPEWDGWIGTTCAYPGRTVETTNPLGRIERAETDTLGRVIRRLNNAGEPPGTANCGEVIYTYDPLGRLKTTTVHYDDGGALTTEIFYDTRGRRIAIDDPDVGVWTYVYNAFGELISQTDAKGQTTTFAYDKLGRMISRYDNDSSTTWNYDAMPGSGGATWKGALHKITHTATGENECTETFAYDSKGRPVTHTRLIDNTSYATGYEYDGASRLAATTYPGGFKVGNTYAPGGWLKEIRAIGGRKSGYYNEVPENHLFWRADSFTPAGSIDAATLGNGLTYDRIINKYTSRVRAIYSSNPQGGDPVQHHEYVYDDVDQLTYRYDNVLGFDDYFEYDGLNRLTGYSLAQSGGGSQLPAGICTYMSIGYNVIGNITYKSDVGSYVYGDPLHPHAVTSINTVPGQFTYDANGNQLTGMGRANTWTAANKLRQIIQNNGRTSTFAFDADRQRIIQQESGGSGGTIKTIYASPLYEKVTTNGLVEEKHYIMTPLGRTAVRTVRSDGDIETRYFHADGHGTIHAVTDEQGQVEQRFHYDPWGKQTEVSNSRGGNGGGRQTRGYTDHEMLNDYNLIHMNARLYDPVIARFISADRVVQDMGDSQTYNRYSYCANNPVNTSDPTGNNFVKWLYFGPDTEEIQELLAEAYSQAREKLREKLTPGASPAPNAGAAASTNGNASATGNSLLNKGSNQDQSNATAGIQSQSNGNNENSNGTAPDNAPGPVINGDGAISPPYSGPYPRGCAIGVLQNLYWKNNPNKVPTIAQIQEATSKYYISINPWDRNPLAPSQIGVKEGVFLGTLAGVVKKGFLSDFDYTATTAFINKTDPDAFSKMIETYKGVGVTLYAEVDGKTTNHAVMYDGVNMYTSAPMTFDDHATAIPTTPQEMLKQMNSSQVLYLVPKQ